MGIARRIGTRRKLAGALRVQNRLLKTCLFSMVRTCKPRAILWPIAAAILFYSLTLNVPLTQEAASALGASSSSSLDIVFAHSHENLTALDEFVQQVLALPPVSARNPRVFVYTKHEGGEEDVRRLVANVTHVQQIPNVGREGQVSWSLNMRCCGEVL